MKIVIDIPKEHYNEIVYVNYERLRDIVRDGVVLEECEDTIGRKAVDKIINKWLSHPDYELKDNIYDMTKKIHKLPSVTPQRPKGKWIHPYKSDIACECSECHIQMPITNYYHYCPNCGAKMSGGGEDDLKT